MTNDNIEDTKNSVEIIDFGSALSERYLSYALTTIMSRSLPDVRDGLKPVHRRLLYAMLKLRLEPEAGYKKCARVVGDVIGKYHPHGDTAIYDTLVRLAQGFSLRYPLIDGQGNFGSIDGDNAAAMRYTESRMTAICMLMLNDIEQDTVDFVPTYDDSDIEPRLLPSAFPNLLANGSEGIAVGMATTIPPHNLHELCDALIYLIDNEKTDNIDSVMQFIKGPDFPTGGVIIDDHSIITAAYKAGRGSFRVRAKWEKRVLGHGTYHIVITEIPYQVQKSKLIEQIATLMQNKRLPLVGNIRDESSDEMRIVIEPKARQCDAQMVMESLFKLTTLESRVQLNMNVLGSDNIPRVMSILQVLQEFIKHRKEIITRRIRFQIKKIENRLEVLSAYKVAHLNIDEVIATIREHDEPKAELMCKYDLNEYQAEAILNLKLRSLRKLEEFVINKEFDELTVKHVELSAILASTAKLKSVIKKELKEVQKNFGFETEIGKRKTAFTVVERSSNIVDISAFVEREPVTIICSKMGWIRAIKGHDIDLSTIKYKEGDEYQFSCETYTTDNIIICGSNGRCYTILSGNITKGKGSSESVKLMTDIENHNIVNMFAYQQDAKMLVASKIGKGFIVNMNDMIAQTKQGKQIMNVSGHGNDVLLHCSLVCGDMIACIGTNRKLLIFSLSEVPEMKRGQGVRLQKYREAMLSDVKTFKLDKGLSWMLGSKTRLEENIVPWQARRGAVGKIPPTGFPKNNRF